MNRVYLTLLSVGLSGSIPMSQTAGQNGFPPTIDITGKYDNVRIAHISEPEETTSFVCQTVKDMNNDGFDDIIVKEYREGDPHIRILYGGVNLHEKTILDLSMINSELIKIEEFLLFYLKVGDIYGDGINDILIMGADEGGGAYYRIYIVDRGPHTLTNRIITKAERENLAQIYANAAIFARADFFVADVNNDRIDDIIFYHTMPNPLIGGPGTTITIAALFIVYGGREMPSRINVENASYPVIRVSYDTTYTNFYFGNFSVGNLNYDDKPDIILQHGLHHDYLYQGSVRQLPFRGTTSMLYGDLIFKPDHGIAIIDMKLKKTGIADFTTNIKKEYESMSNVNMGYIEARLASGDINGDGYDEAIISYYMTIENDEELSHIYVLLGSSDLLYGANLDEMGSGVIDMYGNFGDGSNFDCGDINGDGYNDLLIGCTDNWFYIVYGRNSFPENIYLSVDTSLITTVTGAKLAGCGDINNDGYSDIVANGSDGLYILFGSGETHPVNEAVSHDVPRGRESRFNYSFDNGSSFQFNFFMGRPEDSTKFILANYGRTLPDSLGEIPSGNGVVSFFNTELTNISSSYRLNCSFGYTDSLLNDLGIREEDLSVSYWDEVKNQWSKVPVERDTVLNRVSFTTDHLSLWALADINDPIISSVNDENSTLPQTFELFQNYPNPFNPVTTIRYQVPSRAEVSLKIYNILGQEIRTLVNGHVAEGNYEIQWDGTDNSGRPVSSGVYIYRMTTNAGFAAVRKLVYLK